MVMEDSGVINFKLGSLFMRPFPTSCTWITNIPKHGRYSYRSNAMYCKIFKVDSN